MPQPGLVGAVGRPIGRGNGVLPWWRLFYFLKNWFWLCLSSPAGACTKPDVPRRASPLYCGDLMTVHASTWVLAIQIYVDEPDGCILQVDGVHLFLCVKDRDVGSSDDLIGTACIALDRAEREASSPDTSSAGNSGNLTSEFTPVQSLRKRQQRRRRGVFLTWT